jgi:hypothetical protein
MKKEPATLEVGALTNFECRISSLEWTASRARRLIRVSSSEGNGRYRKPTEGIENCERRISNVEWRGRKEAGERSQNPEFRSQETEFYLATDETQIEHGGNRLEI